MVKDSYILGLTRAKIECQDGAIEVMKMVYEDDPEKLKVALDAIQQCCALIEDAIVMAGGE